LRLLVEGYIELTMSIFLSLYDIFYLLLSTDMPFEFNQSVGDLISIGLTLVILIAVICVPIYTISSVLYKKRDYAPVPDSLSEVLYTNLKKNRKASLVFEGITMLNKLFLVLILLVIRKPLA